MGCDKVLDGSDVVLGPIAFDFMNQRTRQKSYDKHARHFNVHGPFNVVNMSRFTSALYEHVCDPNTTLRHGQYRSSIDAIVYTNSQTNVYVVVEQSTRNYVTSGVFEAGPQRDKFEHDGHLW